METTNYKTAASLTHLGALTQYFIPFGSFIFPVVIWSASKNASEFVDKHGRESINFQLSVFLYTVIMALIAIPTLLFTVLKEVPLSTLLSDNEVLLENCTASDFIGTISVVLIVVFLFVLLKIFEFLMIIYGAVKAANGEAFEYPLRIKFLKQATNRPEETIQT